MEYLWILLSFFCGALPFGVIIAKSFKGIDPRTAGSKNPGTTNVARLCGLPYGLMTLACDALKGALPVYGAMHIFPEISWVWSATALAAILGHIFSPFLGFKGGKGVATTIGALLALSFLPTLYSIICCVVAIGLFGYVSAGSLVLVWVLPIFYFFMRQHHLIPLAMIIFAIVVWTHRGNIVRLFMGEEKSWRKSKNVSK